VAAAGAGAGVGAGAVADSEQEAIEIITNNVRIIAIKTDSFFKISSPFPFFWEPLT
jgi:hypothetical protein